MTRDTRRHKSSGRRAVKVLDRLDDSKLVDGVGQRTTELQIIKRGPIHIESHEPGGVSGGFVVFILVTCGRNQK